MKGKMADTYSYVSGELRCALFPPFVDGILRNTNEKNLANGVTKIFSTAFSFQIDPNSCCSATNARQLKSGKTRLPSIRAIPLWYLRFQNIFLFERYIPFVSEFYFCELICNFQPLFNKPFHGYGYHFELGGI